MLSCGPPAPQGAGLSHGAASRGDGAEAEGARGPSPGRSGAEVGAGPAERPAAGGSEPGRKEQLSRRRSVQRTRGAEPPHPGHALTSELLTD